MSAEGVHEKVSDLVKRYVRKGSHILDIAAGEGALTYKLVKMGYNVVPADINIEQYKLSQPKPLKIDANKSLPFKDGSFDAVISVETIEHLENGYGFLREANRVLKQGGYLILTTPNTFSVVSRILYVIRGRPWGFSRRSYKNIGHINVVNIPLLKWWLEDNGFSHVITTANCIYLPPFCIGVNVEGSLAEFLGQVIIMVFKKVG